MWRVIPPLVLAGALLAATYACTGTEQPAQLTLTRPAETAPFDGTFSWKPVPGASTYNVVVFSPTGSRAFEVRDLTSNGVKLAQGVNLPPGRYRVQVTAMRDGKPVVESPQIEFDIK
jgi:hypothetical protein